MKNALDFIDNSYAAGLIILAIFAVLIGILLLIRRDVKNVHDYPDDYQPSDSKDMRLLKDELMRKDAGRRKEADKVDKWMEIEGLRRKLQKIEEANDFRGVAFKGRTMGINK
jgi:hypothetical protein